ncbi:protein kinase [Streptomyces sp. NPDC003077]|uniref:serine/threonine-protein kinase n=1 Tax=Streptomyces sp. NPDC003077 TaxID=3154443 RepID=UPI0033AB85AD
MTEAAADDRQLVAGRYRLLEQIGRGGMGTVWRSRDELLGREVAVKRLHVSPGIDADELATRNERTRREAQAAARINHPNVVVVHDVVDDNGLPCIVMEYVPSGTLGDLIKEAARADGTVPPHEVARIGRGMIAALKAAHSAGVLHRDVKPGNVLLGKNGRVVLTDFGIAVSTGTSTLTKTGELIGSVDYLAPERVKGGRPGPASDLWALGATLYQALEGRPPFRKATAVETAYAIAMDPVDPPRNAGPLTGLVTALLAKEPDDRPTAHEVEQELRAQAAEPETALMRTPAWAADAPSGTTYSATLPLLPTSGGASASDGTRTKTGAGADAGAVADAKAGATTDVGDGAGAGSAAGAGPDAPAHAGATAEGSGSAPSSLSAPVAETAATTPMAGSAGPEARPATEPSGAARGGTTRGGATLLGAAREEKGTDPADASGGKKRGRAVVWSVVGAVVAVAVAGGALYAVDLWKTDDAPGTRETLPRDHPASAKSTPKPTPKASEPTPAVSEPPPLPAGYRRVAEPRLGISFPVPEGWTREIREGGREVNYVDPTRLVNLKINVLDFATADQVEHFKEVEADFKEKYPVYKRLRLQDTIYQGAPAAIWEFTFQGRTREWRAADLGFGREGGNEYAIYLSAPKQQWDTYAEIFTNVKNGFQQAKQ